MKCLEKNKAIKAIIIHLTNNKNIIEPQKLAKENEDISLASLLWGLICFSKLGLLRATYIPISPITNKALNYKFDDPIELQKAMLIDEEGSTLQGKNCKFEQIYKLIKLKKI